MQKSNIIRRCYDWMLSWSESRWGTLALFLFAFAESSFFPIPPDILLLALCIGYVKKSFRFAMICTTGSVLGAMLGYLLGWGLWDALLHDWFIPAVFSQQSFDLVCDIYQKWNFWAIFTAGLTPIPYKIFTIAAGVCKIHFTEFILASVVARGARFFLEALLIWKYGASIKGFIDKYFNLCITAFTLLLIGGFVLIKYVF